MDSTQIVVTLGTAIAVAMAVIRYWRQIVAFAVAACVGLSVIGLLTVISWVEALTHP